MTGFLHELTSLYRARLERHRNLPMLRGAMAACAVIATIGGEVSFGQRIRVDQILETLEALKVFDPHEGVNLFNEYAEAIFANPRQGQDRALAEVRRLTEGDPEKAELIIRICLAVSEADGAVSLAEQIEIVTLCSLLGVDPARFGLYAAADGDSVLAQVARETGHA
jgi:tellurite resistance protein